jgi:hypothetical protein
MSELDAALAVEPKQPVRTERNFALTKGIELQVVHRRATLCTEPVPKGQHEVCVT